MIKTGQKFFGLKIMLDSTGIDEVDAALKTMFKDQYRRTAPLSVLRPDCQVVLAWVRGDISKKDTLFDDTGD